MISFSTSSLQERLRGSLRRNPVILIRANRQEGRSIDGNYRRFSLNLTLAFSEYWVQKQRNRPICRSGGDASNCWLELEAVGANSHRLTKSEAGQKDHVGTVRSVPLPRLAFGGCCFPGTKVGGPARLWRRNDATINLGGMEEAWSSARHQNMLEKKSARVSTRNCSSKPGHRFQAAAFCEKGHVSFKYTVVAARNRSVVVSARTYTF